MTRRELALKLRRSERTLRRYEQWGALPRPMSIGGRGNLAVYISDVGDIVHISVTRTSIFTVDYKGDVTWKPRVEKNGRGMDRGGK